MRFGDPETQAILPRLRSDLLDLLVRATQPGGLEGVSRRAGATSGRSRVVLAGGGYPAGSSSGEEIRGLDASRAASRSPTRHAPARDGRIVTAGGRILGVTALGADPGGARDAAYAAADMIEFTGSQLRRDIAQRAVERVARAR